MKQALLLVLILLICCCTVVKQGPRGRKGAPAPEIPVITSPATPGQCPTGGTVVVVGVRVIIVCNGLTGVSGADGEDGAPGADGEDGNDGTNGLNGSSCSVTQLITGALVTCSDGTSAYIANGAQGPAGADAPPTAAVTIVPLCTAITTYPTVFSEVGFCLNNKLYGVYSDHGGFMVEIVPGGYSSNGINSSCTLTVHANCLVTH